MGRMQHYSPSEAGIALPRMAAPTPSIFEIRPPGIPANSVPLHDSVTAAVIGYESELDNVHKIYDVNGIMVGGYEPDLGDPVSPLDFVAFGGGLVRALGVAARGAARGAAARGIGGMSILSAGSIGTGLQLTLRSTFRAIVRTDLKFTTTTAARMANANRHVPVHILKLAIRHGRRTADPQNMTGLFQYTSPMLRNGKPYTLKVVLRERDDTVMHFHYD